MTDEIDQPPRTDEELRAIALDIAMGRAFSNLHLTAKGVGDQLRTVFMPLGLMSSEIALDMFGGDDPVILIWEDMSKRGPLAVNGLPTFFSCHVARKAEAEKIAGYIDQYTDAVASVGAKP